MATDEQETLSSPEDEDQLKGGMLKIKFIVTDEEAAALIGTDGETKNEIEAASGAQLHFSQRPVYRVKEGNPVPRAMLVKGTRESIGKLVVEITNRADDVGLRRVAEDAERLKLRLSVPHHFCGVLLGKGGARIKEMSTSSGAWIRISENTRRGHSGSERFLYLAGTQPELLSAINEILSTLEGTDFGKAQEEFVLTVVVPVLLLESQLFNSRRAALEAEYNAKLVPANQEKARVPRTRYCMLRVKAPTEYQARCMEANLLSLAAEVSSLQLPNYFGSPERDMAWSDEEEDDAAAGLGEGGEADLAAAKQHVAPAAPAA